MDPAQALARALESIGGQAPSGRAVAEIRDMYGSNEAMARALAGNYTGRIKDLPEDARKSYKADLRNIERWTKEKGTGQTREIKQPRLVERLERIARSKMQADARRQLREKGAKVRLAGVVVVSKSRRQRDAMPDQEVSPETMNRVLDEWESGEWEARDNAFSELEGGFFDQYEMPGIAYMDDVSELELEIPQ